MQKAQRLTPAERSRAIQRLHTTTLGVTFVSVAATLGFGWVAAVSNPGSQATTASQSTIKADTGTSSANSSSSSSTSTDTTTSDSSLQSSGTVSSSSSGSAHATSGGS